MKGIAIAVGAGILAIGIALGMRVKKKGWDSVKFWKKVEKAEPVDPIKNLQNDLKQAVVEVASLRTFSNTLTKKLSKAELAESSLKADNKDLLEKIEKLAQELSENENSLSLAKDALKLADKLIFDLTVENKKLKKAATKK